MWVDGNKIHTHIFTTTNSRRENLTLRNLNHNPDIFLLFNNLGTYVNTLEQWNYTLLKNSHTFAITIISERDNTIRMKGGNENANLE